MIGSTSAAPGPSRPSDIASRSASLSASGTAQGFALVVCVVLAVQFLLGMYVNLYINLPPVGSGARGVGESMMGRFGAMFSSGPVLMVHMMLGMLLVVLAVVALVVAAGSADRFAIGWSAAGLAALLVAGYGGISFFMLGHNNVDSYLMAVGFLASFAAYLTGALRTSTTGSPLGSGPRWSER